MKTINVNEFFQKNQKTRTSFLSFTFLFIILSIYKSESVEARIESSGGQPYD